jgi:hypothetical protein
VTNTLHRYGSAKSFDDDYIIFAIPCKGANDQGAVEKLKAFLEICARHDPASVGNSELGSYRASANLGPSVHWARDLRPDHRGVVEAVHSMRTVAAVFDARDKAESCLREVIAANLGLSVNVSASVEGAKEVAAACGIKRHSVEYSLGFADPHDHLPKGQVLQLSTMCGHGMVSSALAARMLDLVQEGRRSPDEAAVALARFCPCGAFNPSRAKRLLAEGRP